MSRRQARPHRDEHWPARRFGLARRLWRWRGKSLGELENKHRAGDQRRAAWASWPRRRWPSRPARASSSPTARRSAPRTLAEQLGPDTAAFGLDDIQDALAESDIVISGTSSEEFILGPEQIAPVMADATAAAACSSSTSPSRATSTRPSRIPGVHLCDIDDIEAITDEGWTGRQAEVDRVEAIIAEEVAAFEEWWASLDVVPVITALRDRAEAIRTQELDRALEQHAGAGRSLPPAHRGDDVRRSSRRCWTGRSRA